MEHVGINRLLQFEIFQHETGEVLQGDLDVELLFNRVQTAVQGEAIGYRVHSFAAVRQVPARCRQQLGNANRGRVYQCDLLGVNEYLVDRFDFFITPPPQRIVARPVFH